MKIPSNYRRLALICAVALSLAPGTFVRTEIDPNPREIEIRVTPLAERAGERGGVRGQLAITGAWEITASHPFFGGFSALVDAGDGGLLAGSDRGWTLDLPIVAGEPTGSGAGFVYFAKRRDSFMEMVDLEGMARDPETGTLWTTYEGFNAVQRDRTDGTSTRRAPEEMRSWSANSGPETIAWLEGGSFIILAEAPDQSDRRDRPGLLYAGDPIEVAAPTEFRIATPPKYSPVDATALPDGSVLILLRRVQISVPATFDAAIMRADPAEIEQGGIWSGEIIANLDGPLFGENFEGIAFVPEQGTGTGTDAGTGTGGDAQAGGGHIYLIADDNLSMFQRSLLVRLAWPPRPSE